MLFVPVFWVRCLCFACLGGTHIKKSFVVGWLDGFLRLKDKGLVTAFMLAFEQTLVTIMVLYLMYVN
jgi:hypothetical protein